MIEEAEAYLDYVLSFKELKRPIMPKFDYNAYYDSKYASLIYEIEKDFENIDDYYLTIEHLKGN